MAKVSKGSGANIVSKGTNLKGRKRKDNKSMGEKVRSAIKRRLARGKLSHAYEMAVKDLYRYFKASNIWRMPDDNKVHEA
jgi:hypothetical protein